MSDENLKKVLSDAEGLEITFLVEGGVARVEFSSDGTLHHLDDAEDVVVFIDGRSIPVQSADQRHATALIGTWSDYPNRPLSILIRVGEYFEGWDLD